MNNPNEIKTIELNGKIYEVEKMSTDQLAMVEMYITWSREKTSLELELSKVTLAIDSLMTRLETSLEKTGLDHEDD